MNDIYKLCLKPQKLQKYLNKLDINIRKNIINCKINSNSTPLIIASKNGIIESVKILIEHGADVNIQDDNKETALLNICSNIKKYSTYINIIKLLLDHGADINVKDKYEVTALMYICTYNNIEYLKLLLNYKFDINIQNGCGQTALFYCRNIKNMKLLLDHKFQLQDHSLNINIQDVYGNTALMNYMKKCGCCSCIIINKIEYLKVLLKHESLNLDIQNRYGETALMILLSECDLCGEDIVDIECFKLLLEHGADINIQNKYGYTALMYSIYNIKCFKLLLEYDANINIQNNECETILNIHKNYKFSKLLLQINFNFNTTHKTDILTTACTIFSNINKERSCMLNKLKKFDYDSIFLYELNKCVF